jgi:hypothetical protein
MPKHYRCPGCGRNVRFGKHFCSGTREPQLDDPFPEYRNKPWFAALKKAGILAVVICLLLFLLFNISLPLSVYILVVTGIVIVSFPLYLLIKGKSQVGQDKSPDYKALVRLLHGDREAAERLITAENQKYADFSRQECIRRVHDRLVYERAR